MWGEMQKQGMSACVDTKDMVGRESPCELDRVTTVEALMEEKKVVMIMGPYRMISMILSQRSDR